MNLAVKLLFVASLAVVCNGFKFHTGKDEDAIYNYRSELRVGVKNPKSFASQFVFSGDLHVRSNYDCGDSWMGVLLFFKNPKIYAFNGELDFDEFSDKFNFINFANDELFNFRATCIRYNATGEFHRLDTNGILDPMERNWLRSFASLFQINFDTIASDRAASVYTKTVNEETTHGNCNTKYTVAGQGDEFTVRKTFNQLNCENIAYTRWSNVPATDCPPITEDNFIGQTERIYHAKKMDNGEFLIVNISSKSNAILPLYENYGETHYEVTKQDLVFDRIEKSSEYPHDDTTFDYEHTLAFDTSKIVSDALKTNMWMYDYAVDQKQSEKVMERLRQLNRYLKQEDIRVHDKKYHKDQIFNDILDRLQTLDVHQVAIIHNEIKNLPDEVEQSEVFALFLAIAPIAGTSIIIEYFESELDDLQEDHLLDFLIKFPIHLDHSYDRDSTQFFKKIIKNTKYPDYLKIAAKFAYATEQNNYYDEHEDEDNPSSKKNWFSKFYGQLKSAKTYDDQFIALYALGNIRLSNISNYLVPIIMGNDVLDLQYDWRLRQHAIYISENIFNENDENGMASLWFILENVTEMVELRIAALKVLVSFSSTQENIFRLYNVMKKEQNPHVYNYWYTMLQQEDSISTCGYSIYTHAKWHNFDNRFADAASLVAYSYNQEPYLGYSNGVKMYMIANADTGNPKETIFESYHKFLDTPVRLFSVHIRSNVDIEDMLAGEFMESSTYAGSEVIIKILDRTVFAMTYNSPNVPDLDFVWKTLVKLLGGHTMIAINAQHTYINDIGFASTVYSRIPMFYTLEVDLEDFAKIKLQYKDIVQATYGIKVFNPMVDSLHGAKRFISMDTYATVEVSVDPMNGVVFKPNTFLGTRINVEKGVYFYQVNLTDVLSETCPTCKKYVEAFDNEVPFKDVELYRRKFSDFGFEVVFDLKRCQDYDESTLAVRLEDFFVSNGQFSSIDTENLNNVFHEIVYTLLSTSTCSMHIYATTLPEFKSISFNVGFSGDDDSGNSSRTPFIKSLTEYPGKEIQWIATIALNKSEEKDYDTAEINFYRNATDEANTGHVITFDNGNSEDSKWISLDYSGDTSSGLKFELSINVTGNATVTEKDNKYYYECGNVKRSIWMTTNLCLQAKRAIRDYDIYVNYKNVPEYVSDVFETAGFWIMKTHDASLVKQRNDDIKSDELRIHLNFPVNKLEPTLTAEIQTPNTKITFFDKQFYTFPALNEIAFDITDDKFTCFIVPNEAVTHPKSNEIFKTIPKKSFRVLSGVPILSDAKYEDIGEYNDDNLKEIANNWKWALAFRQNNEDPDKMGPWVIYYDKEFYTNTRSLGVPYNLPKLTKMVDGFYWTPKDNSVYLYLSDDFIEIFTKFNNLVADCSTNSNN